MEFNFIFFFISLLYKKMDAYVKIQSVQGGEITNTQNLLDFRIPAVMFMTYTIHFLI